MRLIILFVLILCPLSADAHAKYLEAYRLFLEENYEQSRELLQSAIREEPDFPEARFLLSKVLFRSGKPRAAIQSFKDGLKTRHELEEHWNLIKSSSPTNFSTGTASTGFQAMKNLSLAKKAFLKGKISLKEGRWYEAIQYFEQATQLDPEPLRYWNALGNALLDVDDVESAELILKESLDKNPWQLDIYMRLMNKFAEKQKMNKALYWLKEARKLYPADQSLNEELFLLKYKIRRLKAGIYEQETTE
jgi:tetratricopeptide (TPR) repeat protein